MNTTANLLTRRARRDSYHAMQTHVVESTLRTTNWRVPTGVVRACPQPSLAAAGLQADGLRKPIFIGGSNERGTLHHFVRGHWAQRQAGHSLDVAAGLHHWLAGTD